MGWFGLFLSLNVFSLLIFLLCFLEYRHEQDSAGWSEMPERLKQLSYLVLFTGILMLWFYPKNPLLKYVTSLPHYLQSPPTSTPTPKPTLPQGPFEKAAFRLSQQGKSYLPRLAPSMSPQIDFLSQTLAGRSVIYRYIGVFTSPRTYANRRQRANHYFEYRYGIKSALDKYFRPQAIIIHSSEGESEQGIFLTFNRNSPLQFLGGAWTHFSIDQNGKIYQYGPLNRISKGQTGVNDFTVGIEVVGHASLWHANGSQYKFGSIIKRFQNRRHPQFLALIDLIKTLKHHYQIPVERIYSHEDVGHIGIRQAKFPDYFWLRTHIRDKVFLAAKPEISNNQKINYRYPFLEPYDRYDPGRDVMRIIYHALGK